MSKKPTAAERRSVEIERVQAQFKRIVTAAIVAVSVEVTVYDAYAWLVHLWNATPKSSIFCSTLEDIDYAFDSFLDDDLGPETPKRIKDIARRLSARIDKAEAEAEAAKAKETA